MVNQVQTDKRLWPHGLKNKTENNENKRYCQSLNISFRIYIYNFQVFVSNDASTFCGRTEHVLLKPVISKLVGCPAKLELSGLVLLYIFS